MANSFWAGLLGETTDILKEADDRNFKMINSSLDYQAKDILSRRKQREEMQRQYDVIAENLYDLEGMDDEKINLVLSKGLDKAKEFLEEAPTYAQARNISVGEMVEISGSGDEITPKDLIRSGRLVDMPALGTFNVPEGLGSGYTREFERGAEVLRSTIGLTDEGEETTYESPEGRILVELFSAPKTVEFEKMPISSLWTNTKTGLYGRAGVTTKYDETTGIFTTEEESRAQKEAIDASFFEFAQAYEDATKMYAGKNVGQGTILEQTMEIYDNKMKDKYGDNFETMFLKDPNNPTKVKITPEGSGGGQLSDDEQLLAAPSAFPLVSHLMKTEGMTRKEAEDKARELRQEYRNK